MSDFQHLPNSANRQPTADHQSLPPVFRLHSAASCLPTSLVLILTVGGCGGTAFPLAPVSGTVTLDGAPVAEGRVIFQPISQGESLTAGPGSYGNTDEQGHFRLKTLHGEQGAVVGPHMVRITTIQVKDSGPAGHEVVAEERIPERYVDGSTLHFTVPADGTDQADFELTSN